MRHEHKGRVISLFWVLLLYALFLTSRLFKLQVSDHNHYREWADAQHLGRAELPTLRGEIRDRNGVVLAQSVSRWSVAIDPKLLRKRGHSKAATALLSDCLALDPPTLRALMEGPERFRWVARKVTEQEALAVRSADVEGVFLRRELTPGKRYYPKGRLASILLGSTGIDDQGLDGIEATFDSPLSGSPGLLQAFVDRDGWATIDDPAAVIRRAENGHHVVLTIDESIQYVAEQELAEQVQAYEAVGGMVIVMDARSAEILALAIHPGFAAADAASVSPERKRNRALTDPYEPGSTFKLFLAAAALECGVSPNHRFRSGGVLRVDGWDIHNASDGLHAGALETLEDILAYSFNIGTATVALHIGRDAFYRELRRFGFGQRTGIELVGESEGLLAEGREWARIHTATISFGQGLACTPIQLVSAAQAVANGGIRVKPTVARAIVDSEGTVVRRFEPEVLGRSTSAETSRQLLAMMENVCLNGTGKRALVPGFRVGGKTGTAQLVENGVYSPNQFIASFLGVAPINDPRIVVLVKIDKPSVQWGGTVAAPVFSHVAQHALWRLGVATSAEDSLGKMREGPSVESW